jgi:hypothetical protein
MQVDKPVDTFPLHERGMASLSDLVAAPYNPRKISKAAMTGLKSSLKRFGVVQEIVVNKRNNRIVGGHQRVDALKSVATDEEVPVVWVDLGEEEEKALNIALNSPHISGDFNNQLDDLLDSISAFDEEMFSELLLDEFLPKEKEGDNTDAPQLAEYKQPFSEEEVLDDATHYWRNAGFPYPSLPAWECKYLISKLANTEFDKLQKTNTAYEVADSYHSHRYASHAKNKKSPLSSFESDDRLHRALEICLTESKYTVGTFRGILSMVRGTQAAANFRPGFACYVYRRICPSDSSVVLDTSTGYGGRLVGAIASGCIDKYIGIDPNVPTHEANTKLAKDMGWDRKARLSNIPAEDYDASQIKESCDAAFTSPPYFCKEIYSKDKTQSWVRYKKPEDWRNGFLKKMLKLQFEALKPGCISAVNIADVRINNKIIELSRWVVDDAIEAGFIHEDTWEFPITTGYGQDQDHQESFEPVYIFRKPGKQEKPKKKAAKKKAAPEVGDVELHELFTSSDKGHSMGPDSSFRKTDGQSLIRKGQVKIVRDPEGKLQAAASVRVVGKSTRMPGFNYKKGDLLIERVAYTDLSSLLMVIEAASRDHEGGNIFLKTWNTDKAASQAAVHCSYKNIGTDRGKCEEDILVWMKGEDEDEE